MKYLITAFLVCSSMSVLAQDAEFELVKSTVDQQEIKDHIHYLASDEMAGRNVGSLGIDMAADYIAQTLKKYGAQPVKGNDGYFQNIPFQRTKPATKVSFSLNDIEGVSIAVLEGANMSASENAVFLNYGSLTDFESKNVSGKLVVVKAGSEDKQDFRSSFFAGRNKRQLAQKHGAKGLVEIISTDNQSWNFIAGFTADETISLDQASDPEAFAHVWVRQENEALTKSLTDSPKVDLTIAGVVNEKFISKNIVAMIPGSDAELAKEFIIYSAHYDHLGISKKLQEGDSIFNGARDNAVGVVTVLSAAQNIGKYPTKRSALLILFTAEEKGLLGSQYYVANPSIPLNQMAFCFNSDNGGYNDTSIATIIGLKRTTMADHIVKAAELSGLKAMDDPAPEQNLFDRSDNVHFAAAGIPAPTFSLGFTAFDEEIAKYYHQVTDNPETLDYDYLLKFFQSYVLSSRYIANDPKTPFWVEGDKYYEAGKSLYAHD